MQRRIEHPDQRNLVNQSDLVMLSRVFYKSQSAYPVGHASDTDILNTAISRNEVHDLTGFLLRGKHWFAQCLEGPRAELETVFQLIIADQRHFDVQDMWSHQLPDREFGGSST